MAALYCQKPTLYRPRRPEKTVFFEAIKKHHAAWHKEHEIQVPQYILNTFQKYLGCGILAKGFACAHCNACAQDFLIAFSCKGRGICLSCNRRAMVETTAHLIENVLAGLPFRQFVISFPMRIRYFLKTHAILQCVLRIVIDEIRKCLISCSPTASNSQIGTVSFIQHFGNTLNYHPHFHVIAVDPLVCSDCGSEIKIIFFVVHSAQIRRILSGIPWPTDIPEFDTPR